MAQENSEMATKFSTLNVNAVEFVPSFGFSNTRSAPTTTTTTTTTAAAAGGGGGGPPPSEESNTTTTPNVMDTSDGNSAQVTPKSSPATTPESAAASDASNNANLLNANTNVTATSNATTTATAIAIAASNNNNAVADTEEQLMDSGAINVAAPSPVPSTQDSPMDTSPTTTLATNNIGGIGGGAPAEDLTTADCLMANNDDPADSWDNDDDPVITPEDDEDVDGDGEILAKVTKKRASKIEESRSKKEHVNVVFIGHVDAGKSTIGGQIMSLTGMVDKRTLEKYEREAREKSRESWYLSWALDTNQEERDKGKTVEVGRAYFETERKHFTILDAPGHKSFVPNMIGGAAQADLAVLVLSARKGEFETGFDRGGQTREHAMLAKTAGVKHLVVLVNKMDDPTVNWDETRYNECKDKILPYLKKLGFNLNKDLTFMPCSGLSGLGLRDPIPESICPWFSGPAFIPFIDELPSLNRKSEGPFIMPIVDKYKDMGTVVMGKVESGEARKGQNLLVMPNRTQVSVDQLFSDDDEVTSVGPGENVKIKLKGIEEEDVSPGFVLCDASNPIKTGKVFDAQVVILEHKSIICAGYSAVMHIHCAAEEITVKALICLVDKKSGDKSKTRPRFVKQDQVAIMRIECSGLICLEQFKLFPQMGRFTLRDENKTIAIGKVLKVIE